MIVTEKWILSYFVCSILIGASLFLYGFFPLSYTSNERAGSLDLPVLIDDVPLNKSIYRRHVSRSVLMVIDAMRTDFIENQQNTSMKYLNKMINDNTACMLNLKVEVPTVTMPRIKAMTTGTVPNFIDVVLNLGSSELHMDSILHQIYDNNGKMVFCGDNTWVKMFPEMFHRKLENVDSLYVNDFYEGDKNITRKLSEELKRSDWEMLILHFLGLNHIGHVEGPFSSKVPTKLREMDTIILHIHLAMQHWMQSLQEPPLFIITGDHGMRDSGGHGGSSYAEVNVPLIFAGPSCLQNNESYNQIDIPATLSVLLGLPIPASSVGVLIPHLLNALTNEHKLYAYYYNSERLLRKLIAIDGEYAVQSKEFYFRYSEAKTAHKTFLVLNSNLQEERLKFFETAQLKYITASKAMSQKLADSFVKFDLVSIVFGLITLVTTLLYISLSFISNIKRVKVSLKYAILFCLVSSLLHHNFSTDCLLTSKLLSVPLMALIYFTVMMNIQFLIKIIPNVDKNIMPILNSIRMMPKICMFLTFGIVLHGISTTSSSFIEEEHQLWYYLNNTVWLVLYIMETKKLLNTKSAKVEWIETILQSQFKWALLVGGHWIARKLNQTGDKWLNIPDIGDWLQMDENRTWNSWFVFGSLLLLYLSSMGFGSILTNVLTITACILIYYYRTVTGSVFMAGVKSPGSTDTCMTLFWLNICEIAAINFVPILCNAIKSEMKRFDMKLILGTLVVLTTLIVAMTHKPHNIFLTSLLLFSCKQINDIDLGEKNKPSELIKCVLHLWIGKQFFFYQGNSNSLASIDLNAGYVGLNTFNFVIVGIFLTLNTFSGPILSFLTFVHSSYDCVQLAQSPFNKSMLSLLILLIAFPFILYVFIILFMRQHIFIWSVFSPKLLYEFYYLFLMLLMWFFVRFIPTFEHTL